MASTPEDFADCERIIRCGFNRECYSEDKVGTVTRFYSNDDNAWRHFAFHDTLCIFAKYLCALVAAEWKLNSKRPV